MLRKLGLAGEVLGMVFSLALPVSGLARERNDRNDRESGYSWTNDNRGFATSTYRRGFDQHSRQEMPFDREGRFQMGPVDSQIRSGRSNNSRDRGGENNGWQNSSGFSGSWPASNPRRG
jgi:hypothetical protein